MPDSPSTSTVIVFYRSSSQPTARLFHSTETAILRVLNDMIGVVDQGHIGALMLLDLSAAFDTVDHSILMEVLRRRFGVEGNALSWLAQFLRERSQVVRVGESESDSLPLHFGVPHGSVLGPKRFIEYTENVDDLAVREAQYAPPLIRRRHAGFP